MEKEIFNILITLSYKSKLNKLYDDKSTKFEFPMDLDELSFDVIIDFNNEYFNKYKHVLLKNALIYIINNNLQKYIDIFNGNDEELKMLLNKEQLFRANITKFAYFNIRDKFNNKNYNDKELINNNKELFDKLCINYNSFTNIYRKIIIDFLNKIDEEDIEIILDDILFTNIYDIDLINDNKEILNITNINFFKNILVRLILSDNYLNIKTDFNSYEIDYDLEFIDDEDNEYNDYELVNDEEYEYEDFKIKYTNDENKVIAMNKKILDYIENSLLTNNIILPNSIELRLNLYSKFLVFNMYDDEKKSYIENVKEDKESLKKLKKLNPLYFMDLIDNN